MIKRFSFSFDFGKILTSLLRLQRNKESVTVSVREVMAVVVNGTVAFTKNLVLVYICLIFRKVECTDPTPREKVLFRLFSDP